MVLNLMLIPGEYRTGFPVLRSCSGRLGPPLGKSFCYAPGGSLATIS